MSREDRIAHISPRNEQTLLFIHDDVHSLVELALRVLNGVIVHWMHEDVEAGVRCVYSTETRQQRHHGDAYDANAADYLLQ